MKNLKKAYNVFSIVFALMLIVSVVIVPLYGLGDMSEYMTVFENVGLYNSYEDSCRVVQQYGISEGNGAQSAYEHFLSGVVAINRNIFSETVFDIHFLSTVYVILFLIGLYILQKEVRFEKEYLNYGFCALLGIVYLDLGYVAYFNSFYSEALVFVLIVFLTSLVVSTVKRFSWLKLVLVVLVACAFSTLKVSCAVVSLALSVIMGVLLIKNKQPMAALLMCITVIVSVVSMFNMQIPARNVKLYNLVYNDLMQNIETGLEVKEEYKNAETVEQMREAVDGITYTDVIRYYSSNPKEFLDGVRSAVNNSYFLILDYAPYRQYGESYGVRELLVPKIWNFLKRRVLPNGLWVMLLFIIAFAVVAVKEYIKYLKTEEKDKAGIAFVALVLPIGTLSELIGTVITTGKIMISKNMFVYGVYFDMMLVVTVAWAVSTLISRRKSIKEKYGVEQ